eukprot:CAMPEP_0180663196 /NCGR_PEP_ID=MMETSP1037_2-20121125/59818_1 /TAXON_ID=632150 /ORGANISM="Azadinium spinosum, Strain 3D9" /LENGTH=70 /DNA_ID=CAMNT_0022690953 /DNA_START=116 /DNA_END=324 /DNA_ORIENTATION=+
MQHVVIPCGVQSREHSGLSPAPISGRLVTNEVGCPEDVLELLPFRMHGAPWVAATAVTARWSRTGRAGPP